MQTSRVLRASPAFSSSLRPFSTSSAYHRSPSIRDITPTNAADFDARQKEFRQSLEDARKKREEQESQSVADTLRDRAREFAPTAPIVSNASVYIHPIDSTFPNLCVCAVD
jgi:hypothetical protein